MRLRHILEFGPSAKAEVLYYTYEPMDDVPYDPLVAADQAENVASKSGIRIDSTKELTLIAVNDHGDVVGAVWTSF